MAEWEEYDKLEPTGSYKMDFHFARLRQLMIEMAQSAWGGGKRRTSKVMDFMPHWFMQYHKGSTVSTKRQSWQEMKAMMMALAKDSNRKRKR